MTINVSLLGRQQHTQSLLGFLKTEMADAQVQVSSGKKSQDFTGLASDAFQSISLRKDINRLNNYQDTIVELEARTETMDKVMVRITEIARDVMTDMLQYPRSKPPSMDILNETARQALDVVQELMNTATGGRFLFAGDEVATQPIQQGVIEPLVDPFSADLAAGAITGADFIAGIDALTLADMGYDADVAAAGANTAVIGDGRRVDYTVNATNEGFQDIVRGLAALASMEYNPDPAISDEFYIAFDNVVSKLDVGARKLDIDIGGLGLTRQTLEDERVAHDNTKLTLDRFLGEVEDVDLAEAIVNLQNIQTQLEATYQSIAQLRDLSLTNFLR